MKKKIITLALGVGILATLTSCVDIFDSIRLGLEQSEYSPIQFQNINEYGNDYEIDKDKLEEAKNTLDSIINGTYTGVKPEEAINSNIKYLNSVYTELDTKATYSYIMFNYTSSTYYNKEYTEYFESETEIKKWLSSFYQRAYTSSYKDYIFEGWTDDQIAKLKKKTDKYYELSSKLTNLEASFDELYDYEKLSKANEFYSDYTQTANDLAKELGYNNYMDYAYENVYYRDYTVTEGQEFTSYVKKYIVPAYEEQINKYKSLQSKTKSANLNDLARLLELNYKRTENIINDYVKAVGGDYEKNYNYLMTDGLRVFSSNSYSSGAFTTTFETTKEPVVFYGADSQNSLTLLHEFGHYNAAKINNYKNLSYDLAETQSQGSEALYLSYLVNKKNFTKDLDTLLYSYELCDFFSTIIVTSMVHDFEIKAYNQTSGPVDYNNIMNSVLEDYGGYDYIIEILGTDLSNYWPMVCITSAGYYISYATSLTAALTLLTTDFEDSVANYNILAASSDLTFKDALAKANMKSPFKEQTFIDVSNINK